MVSDRAFVQASNKLDSYALTALNAHLLAMAQARSCMVLLHGLRVVATLMTFGQLT